jgi:mannose-6-phosphate isomerase-like protein (cupin superfamily)
MQELQLEDTPDAFFRVLGETERSQAAILVLQPGRSTGGDENTHRGDQWMLVLSGTGEAAIEGRRIALRPGALVLIEAGERHEVRAGDEEPLRTVNIYAPPSY